MTINLNVSPWYDDFDANNNYNKILYVPERGVQARELTQSQSILQNQLTKLGDFILADGSKSSGGESFQDTNVRVLSILASTKVEANIGLYKGLYAYGVTSGIVGIVSDIEPDLLFLIVKPITLPTNTTNFIQNEVIYLFATKEDAINYTHSNLGTYLYSVTISSDIVTSIGSVSGIIYSDVLSINTTKLNIGDIISNSNLSSYTTVIDIIDTISCKVNVPINATFSNQTVTATTLASRIVLEVSIDSGTYYTNGYFTNTQKQSIIPSYFTKYVTTSIGYEVQEYVVTNNEDTSLLDPALGASSYAAPGADRLKINLVLTAKPFVDGSTTTLTDNKFIEVLRFIEGNVQINNNIPILGDIEKTLARRTYDESGNYSVKPYNLILNNSNSADPVMTSTITPGKSYIHGHEIETIAGVNISIDKGRDYSNTTAYNLAPYYGNYITVNKANNRLSDINHIPINLYNTANIIVANSFIINAEYSGSANTYNLYLGEITGNITYANTIRSLDMSVRANVINANTVDTKFNKLIYTLPQINIKSISNANYTSRALFSAVFVNGYATIYTTNASDNFEGSGLLSSTQAKDYFTVITTTTNGAYINGQFVDVAQPPITITTAKIQGQQGSATLYIGNYSGTADVWGTFEAVNVSKKIKTLSADQIDKLSVTAARSYLTKSDIYQFKGLFEVGAGVTYIGTWSSLTTYAVDQAVLYLNKMYVSLTNGNLNIIPTSSLTNWSNKPNVMGTLSETLDNGQKDTYYTYGSIVNSTYTGSLLIWYNYFTHTGTGYFTAESYPIDYSIIPTYTSTSGKIYNLRDCVDFRARNTDGGTQGVSFDSSVIPTPESDFLIDYSYYLSRMDKLVLTQNGEFQYLKGISSYTNLIPPADISTAMTLFDVTVPAYTFDKKDVSIVYHDNRRYTMADIGRLDKRISNVEYYTSLSLLEKEVLGKDVTDSNNLILYKNGFLVDNFTGHGVGDTNNSEYNVSVDFNKLYARPKFISNMCGYDYDLTNSDLMIGYSLISFKYTKDTIISQLNPTDVLNVNPFNVLQFRGTLQLFPQTDTWYDTKTNPIINVVNQDTAAWNGALAQEGSQWNDWAVVWTGTPATTISHISDIDTGTTIIDNDRSITQTPETVTRLGVKTTVTSQLVKTSDVSKIVSSEIIKFARSIDISFNAHGLPPLTVFHLYGNGILLSAYTKPTTNPLGKISLVQILNGGSGYTAPTIAFVGSCTVAATATLSITGGVITDCKITSQGLGYTLGSGSCTITDATGTSAVITYSTIPNIASDLITDESGDVSGVLHLPCDNNLRFATGKIRLTISDHITSIKLTGSYAEADFISSGVLNTTQETIISQKVPIVNRENLSESKNITETTIRDVSNTKPKEPTKPTQPPVPSGGVITVINVPVTTYVQPAAVVVSGLAKPTATGSLILNENGAGNIDTIRVSDVDGNGNLHVYYKQVSYGGIGFQYIISCPGYTVKDIQTPTAKVYTYDWYITRTAADGKSFGTDNVVVYSNVATGPTACYSEGDIYIKLVANTYTPAGYDTTVYVPVDIIQIIRDVSGNTGYVSVDGFIYGYNGETYLGRYSYSDIDWSTIIY